MTPASGGASGTGPDPLQHNPMEGDRQIAAVGVARNDSGRRRRVGVQEGEVYPVTPMQICGRDQALQLCFSGQGKIGDFDFIRQNGEALHRHGRRANERPHDQLEQQIVRFVLLWKCELGPVANRPGVGSFGRSPTGTEIARTVAAGPEYDFGHQPVRVVVAMLRGFSGWP
jgi:hypothetical protein